MRGWTWTRAAAAALAMAACLGAAPGTPPPPAMTTAADTKPEPVARTKFENGEPINDYFTALAIRFGVMVVQSKPTDAFILQSFEMPAKLEDALAIARQILEPQGLSVVQSVADKRLVIRIMPTKDAQKLELAESPVTFGTGGEKIDISRPERQVTHILPIAHVDMIETLRRSAMQDPAVSAEIAGGAEIGVSLILTGPALKVQRTVEAIAKLDRPVGGQIIARTLALQHLDAQNTADALNERFAQDPAPMKAVADRRTNSIVVTGPQDLVLGIMVTLVAQDGRRGPIIPPPATFPAFTLPAIPTTQPVGGKPGAARTIRSESLDETANGGNNADPGAGPVVDVDSAESA